jgi:uncharacterized protein
MISLYDATVPVFRRALGNLDALLVKGAAHFAETGRPEAELTGLRLIADMQPLTAQVQRASDTAKGVCVRVAGMASVAMPDQEVTVADLRDRIARTVTLLDQAPREAFERDDDAPVHVVTPQRTLQFTARGYVLDFALPNFFFHVTTAYALLRKEGVPIGKADYLGPF